MGNYALLRDRYSLLLCWSVASFAVFCEPNFLPEKQALQHRHFRLPNPGLASLQGDV